MANLKARSEASCHAIKNDVLRNEALLRAFITVVSIFFSSSEQQLLDIQTRSTLRSRAFFYVSFFRSTFHIGDMESRVFKLVAAETLHVPSPIGMSGNKKCGCF